MPTPEPLPLDILFEDPWLIAVNKPAGLVVHPSYKNPSGTLLNGILAHRHLHATPGIVTRLDKGTSGLVLVALTSQVHRVIQRDGVLGDVRKQYLAVVRGTPSPPHGTIVKPLGRDAHDRRRVVVQDTGTPSETQYDVIATAAGCSLVRCELVTGRTHQIRVHLASQGWPIEGDITYGSPHPAIPRQTLHAWRLDLPHPLTRHPLSITAPLADDIRAAFPELTRHIG